MVKRLRSLASVLWDSDTEDVGPDFWDTNEKQLDVAQLKGENAKLREELEKLRQDNLMLRVPKPSHSVPLALDSSRIQSLWPKQQWLACLGQELVQCRRLHDEILPELEDSNNANHCILFHLCKSPKASASTILGHVERCVCDLSRKHPAVFKVGITCNPVRRWRNAKYGYAVDKRECWLGMKILAICDTSFSAGLIESFLIRRFLDTPGCRNDRPGGETPSPTEAPHFVYVVYRILLPPARVVSPATMHQG